nr:unnamed protein product [Callosobruchus chinensis]
MIVSDKDIAVYSETCNSQICRRGCTSPLCSLCKTCLAADTRQYLIQAYKEHMHKGDCKRIFPPTMTEAEAKEGILTDDLTPENRLMYKWFQGKCLMDRSWC